MTTKRKSQSEIPKGTSVVVVAGEHSGDLLGKDLLHELKIYQPDWSYFGVGGSEMASEGLLSLEDMERLSVIGFSEAIQKYSFLKEFFHRLLMAVDERKPKLAILIDYPGFNLRLAKELKKRGIPTIFYVSPQIWAWKFRRIFFIKEHIDLMLTLFRFEEELYIDYGVNALFVGHPLTKRIPEKLRKEPSLPEPLPKPPNGYTVGLLPGSRKGEIRRLLPVLLDTAVLLQEEGKKAHKKISFLLPNINPSEEPYIQTSVKNFRLEHPDIDIHYLWNSSLRVMEKSDVLLIASGTATLEGLYFTTPMVILYKVSLFTYFLGSLLMRSKFIGLANILSGEEVCREMIQNECDPKYVAKEAWAILSDAKLRNKMKTKLLEAKERELGMGGGAKKAAKEISFFWKSLSK